MPEFFKKTFSKALLLCYFFIGYVAVAERDTPKCFVESNPFIQLDDTPAYFYHDIRLLSAHQARSVKQVSDFQSIVQPDHEIGTCDRGLLFESHFYLFPFNFHYYSTPSARAPPVS